MYYATSISTLSTASLFESSEIFVLPLCLGSESRGSNQTELSRGIEGPGGERCCDTRAEGGRGEAQQAATQLLQHYQEAAIQGEGERGHHQDAEVCIVAPLLPVHVIVLLLIF